MSHSVWQLFTVVVLGLLVLEADGSEGTFTTLYSFDGSDGTPYDRLVEGTDGSLYGITTEGGRYGYGSVFKITKSGSFYRLHSFGISANGRTPGGGLQLSNDGIFYGTTSQAGAHDYGTVFKITQAGALTTLFSFENKSGASGSYPRVGLGGPDNYYFYGVTANSQPSLTATFFRITPAGALATIYRTNISDMGGGVNVSRPLLGIDGHLYGTTRNAPGGPHGGIYKLTNSGGRSFSFIHSFSGNDGSQPSDTLIQGRDGFFYGTTRSGGANSDGTVFKISPQGAFTLLHSFKRSVDGARPLAAPVQCADGNYYGTTSSTIFKITPAGVLTTLYSGLPGRSSIMSGQPDGALTQGSDGNLYGTTSSGGTYSFGTVFRFTIPLVQPTAVVASNGTFADKVRLAWTDSFGATSYEVQRATSASGTKTWIGTSTGTCFDDTTVVAGTIYYYWIKAANAYGKSDFSSPDSGFVAEIVMQCPDILPGGQVVLKWNNLPGRNYTIRRTANLKSGFSTRASGVSNGSFTDDVEDEEQMFWMIIEEP